jgi:uridine kinase
VNVEFSVSTWRQPVPSAGSPERDQVLERLVEMIEALGDHRLRVAIDGLTAAGKTSLGHELARGLSRRGRPVLRASLDDFKLPWRERHLYDRESGVVALCSIDPLTQLDHSSVTTAMPANGVLIVDGVFAYRPEINAYWDLRIWVEIDAELSVLRGIERDDEMEGGAVAAEALHRDRYLVGEQLYISEVDPCSFVEVIVDNTDFDHPRIVRPAG